MNQEIINKILNETEIGYDQIADKFSHTRKFFWRGYEFIPEHIKNNDRILDYGSGNGRLLEILKDKNLEYFGVDISEKLINLAKEKYPEEKASFSKISSLASLAFSDNFFNKIISVAVFHHFPEKHAREVARELYRVTKPEGEIIISVWNLWQKKYIWQILSPRTIFKKIFHSGKFSGLGFLDVHIPFKDNAGKIFERYHFAWTQKKLKKIFSSAGFKIEKVFVLNKRNIVLIGKK